MGRPKDFKHSEETRSKISQSLVGNKRAVNSNGVIKKRRKKSIEERRHLSEIQRGRKGNNWKGGARHKHKIIRDGIDYRLWRESVFARDNWVCQKCGDSKGGNLNAHHLKNFAEHPDLRFAIDNGITICTHCHLEFHKKYGQSGNDEKQIAEFVEAFTE